MRDFLRSLPVFAGVIRDFDTDGLPDDPAELFSRWLHEAVEDLVPEPHAMTLSTTDPNGAPDARTLILKDLNDQGWWFASSAASAKGTQLAAHSAAALTFYWPLVGRQIRIRGRVRPGSAELSAADFQSRGVAARAVALASHESQPLSDRGSCEHAVAAAVRQLTARPDLLSPDWQVYVVTPETVEFWQADKDRLHTRVQYRCHADDWTHTLLWP
jgi:pyridoxamine 5'-phosphate oxidase